MIKTCWTHKKECIRDTTKCEDCIRDINIEIYRLNSLSKDELLDYASIIGLSKVTNYRMKISTIRDIIKKRLGG